MPSIECMGETFEVHTEISAFALRDFSKVMARTEDEVVTPEVIDTMFALIEDCIVPDEWPRFERVARAKRAGFSELFAVVKAMTEANAERPTGRSSDSSDGPTNTAPKSELSSADKALADSGLRPDQKLAILRARDTAA